MINIDSEFYKGAMIGEIFFLNLDSKFLWNFNFLFYIYRISIIHIFYLSYENFDSSENLS